MSPTAQLILALIRARATRLAAWMEDLWRQGQTSPDQGPAIGAGEVARLLAAAEPHHQGPLDEDQALAADPLWRRIGQNFGLSRAEQDLLALLVAVELDPGLGRVVAYLHDDGRMIHPTPWLAAKLAGSQPVPFVGENLRRWLLAAPMAGLAQGARLISPWQLDPAVALSLAEGSWRDILIEPQRIVARQTVLHPGALEALMRLCDVCGGELCGPPGIGKRGLAAQFAACLGLDLVAIDLRGDPLPSIVRGLRLALMTGALAYFVHADLVSGEDWARAKALGVPYLRGARHPTGTAEPIELAPLSLATRLGLWSSFTPAPPPARLISQRHTASEIVALAEGRQARAARPDHALLTRLPTPYAWDDLILPDDAAAQLRAFEAQVRLRWLVYEDWGFSRLTHLGQGISALFGGISGTGKTMAAQVIAGSLGLDLLRVDLAGVVNKYVGETEKKLREVFDACEDSGALLFFDEADALFGNRTQVKDAHDRFANIEIDYLLQRIERFDGVAILATNRRQDLDPAFVRRLRFMIEFLPPRPNERRILWRRALGPASRDGIAILGDIDVEHLADRLIMTGAEIKGTVLAAAFLAHDEGTPIEMRHLFLAAQREMEKKGERLRIPAREAAE